MKKDINTILDCKNKKLNIDGNCLEVLDVCKALCCRYFNVDMSFEEFSSGKYKAHPFCGLSNNKCDKEDVNCKNRSYRLDRNEDGVCVYLDEKTSLCSIYDSRPEACRGFKCKGGWKISFDFTAPDVKTNTMIQRLSGDMVFVTNPLFRSSSVFYAENKKQYTFVKNQINNCSAVTSKDVADIPGVDCGTLRDIVGSFDGQRPLSDILERINKMHDSSIGDVDFCTAVRLLINHDMITFKYPDKAEDKI